MVASVLVAPGDISAAASKTSKAGSLLGKVGTFSKSIAVSSVENVKNIVTLPVRLLDNIGNKVADLETIFSKGKGLVVDFTKSVVVSSAKNANTCFSISRAAGAGLEAGYKGIVAGGKEAKSVLKVVKGEENGLADFKSAGIVKVEVDLPENMWKNR